MRCIAYCIAEHYNLKKMAQFFESQGTKIKLYNKEVLHLPKYKEGSDIFIFDYGCLVFWDYAPKVETQILSQISEFASNPHARVESDEFDFEILQKVPKTTMLNDSIQLKGNRILEKLTISFGLSQSIKLATFEETLEKTIQETRGLPEDLATHGKISLSRREISKKMGQLFLVRNSINLHTEILDTPDFFWEYPEFEPIYKMVLKNLDVPQRAEILNRRLDMIRELFSMLGNEVNHQHSSMLEWIIIILISVEIGLFFIKELGVITFLP